MGIATSRFCRTAAAAAAILVASWTAGSELPPLAAAAAPSAGQTVVQVSTEAELQDAVAALTSGTTIVLAPGTYKLTGTLSIKGALTNVGITGATNNPNDVVLVGMGMTTADGAVPHGISVGGSVQGVTISNLTIRDVFKHAISLEPGSEAPRLYNLRLVDAGRQFVKAYPDGQGGGVDDGVVEGSVMEYTVEAPGADTGGVHVAGGARWVVRGNRFSNIKAAGALAAPAVLVAQGARDSIVEGNTFVNCQQEIALGAEDRTPNDHAGGMVRNNFIARDFTTNGGVAIQLADSPVTQVLHNTILSNTASASLIEYRFADTTGAVIRNNLLDGNVTARDGATGTAPDNYTRAVPAMFAAPSTGDLHLLATAVEAIDQATAIADASTDFDGDVRPQGAGADYGADEAPATMTQASTSEPLASTTSTTSTTQATTTSTDSSSTSSTPLGPKGLPGPWDWTDVGPPRTAGSVTWSSNTFTVNAAGADIGGNHDEYTFVYQTLEGDGEIVARVGDLHRTHTWSKAGLMFRDELLGGAKYAGAFVTADKGLYFQSRISTGSNTTQTWGASGTTPQWLKLARQGQTFTAFASADGVNWTKIGSETVPLNKLAYVGLAVTSHSWRNLTTATFTGVAVTAAAPDANEAPQVSITSPTSGTSFNTPCTIVVTAAASDQDGSVTRVEFYSGSTLIGTVDRPPFTLEWKDVPPGIHKLKARVQDDDGATGTSPEVEIDVTPNQAPAVSLTTPAPGASYAAPASIALTASASDADGTVTQVDFFAGSTLIGSDTTAPYTASWTVVPAGSYTITAVAHDNSGATSTSAAAAITVTEKVNAPPAVTLSAPSPGSVFTAGTPITMTATASDTDGSIAKVEFYAGSTLIGSDTSSPYSATWNGATAGNHTLSAKAFDNANASTTSPPVNVTVDPASTLPAPWQTADVGNPAVAGSASYSTESFSVKGAGTDIWNTSDQFRFVYQQLEADGAVSACVTSLEFVDSWTKAGVMIRQSLAPDSPYAYSMLSAGWGVTFQYRTAAAQAAVGTEMGAGVAPHCLRLVRKGSTFTAYQSMDGSSWAPMGSVTIAMSSQVLVGLAVTSHNTTRAAEAVFDRVGLGAAPENQAPSVTLTGPAAGASFTAPATVTLTATASDSDGSVAGVDFYAGTTKVGSDSSSPYSVTWSGAAAGTYTVTAVARDDSGAMTTSAPVSITVSAPNQAPVVSITAPSSGASFTSPATITLSASASDSDGTVASVEFYAGTTLIRSDTSSPYSVSWSNVPAGSYSVKAIAKDNDGATATSATVSVTVAAPPTSQPPVVTLTSPTNNASFNAPANITVTASASAADGAVVPAGLVAHWQLDESSGSIAADSVGQNSGTLSNGPVRTAGQMGGAVRFDGTSQYIALPNMDVSGSTLTLTAWVSSAAAGSTSAYPRIISKSTGTPEQDHYWMLGTTQLADGTNRLRFRVKAGGTTTTLVASSGNLPVDTWYHAAATYDGQMMRLYLNGVEVGSISKTGSLNTNASVPVNIARNPDGSYYLDGALDDVRIYSAGLTPDEIRAVINGNPVAAVDFYAENTLIGSSNERPYSINWNDVPAGNYTLTAVARDHNGATATSAPVGISVAQAANQPPVVSLTSPASGTTYAALADIGVSATASDSDGTISRVDFYAGSTLIGSDTSSPYSLTWTGVPTGSYTLTAVARDNSGATTTSAPISVTVSTSSSTSLPKYVVFYASTDHDTNVTSYTVEFFAAGVDPATATPARVQNIGKPAPVNGEITVNVESTVQGLPSGTYVSTVSANGSGGSSRSVPSETFVR